MTRFKKFNIGITMALALTSCATLAQQPAPPPPVDQSETGWRKFNGGQPLAVPGSVVVPAGTWVTIRVNDVISTDRNVVGDAFTATLSQPLVADGIVVAQRGQTLGGRVVEAVKGGRVKGTARLGLEVTELSLVDGRQVPVRTQLISYSSGTSYGRDASAIAYSSATGAAIGGMADGGTGAGIGALAGAAAAVIGVLVTHGRAAEVYPEAAITFRLLEPLAVSTERASAAFRPATPQDYETRLVQRAAVQVVQPSPLYLGFGYGFGYPYYYPSYWYGPGFRYYGGPRYYGGGYYRGGYGGHYGGGYYGGRPGAGGGKRVLPSAPEIQVSYRRVA